MFCYLLQQFSCKNSLCDYEYIQYLQKKNEEMK